MSQVFSVSAHCAWGGFAFQGFYKRAAEPKAAGFQDQLYMHARIKPKRSMLITRRNLPGPLTLTNFRSRKSEAASPGRRCSQPTMLPLDLAGLRRGLASETFR
jgi:hypothetical protein